MEKKEQPQRAAGLTCPRCGGFIATSVTELLTSTYLRCPRCLLQLNIDRQQSARALSALSKVEDARRQVDRSSKFNG